MLTLTYDDENLPINEKGHPTLVKYHMQKFTKDLRNYIKRTFQDEYKVKYYTVGEYGDLFQRPHYHSIMYNLPRPLIDHPSGVNLIWDRGRVQIDDANNSTMAYVTGYVAKKFKSDQPRHNGIPEFNLMSKGLGLSWITKRRARYLKQIKQPFITLEGGEKIAIPRLFKDYIFDDIERHEITRSLIKPISDDTFENEQHKIEYIKRQFDAYKSKSKTQRNANSISPPHSSRNEHSR
jgi:hypothetical protein